jgi:hypothetical protein
MFWSEKMNIRALRSLLWVVSLVQLALAAAFYFQLPFATKLWPLPYTNEMSFIFLASVFAAAAASTLWCLIAGENAALAGVALDYVTIFTPVAAFAFQIARNQAVTLFGIISVGMALFGLAMFLWTRRIPFKYTRPMPRPIRYSFVFFIAALLITGGAMILKTPNIMPWSVSAEASVLYGWFFLGAAAYFIYGLLRPVWGNAGGQLAGFLVYDLVLILPFIAEFSTIRPQLRLNLIIYMLVVLYSGGLAIYYLFIHPQTRLWQRRAAVPATESVGV